MKEEIFGPVVVFWVKIIGAWPGPRSIAARLFVGLFMLLTIVSQVFDVVDYKHYAMFALMESVAITITNMLSFGKFICLWINQGNIRKCLDMVEEDWKEMCNPKYLEMMSRNAKFSRTFCVCVLTSYYSTVVAFIIRTLCNYTPEDLENFQDRELVLKASYPFNVFHSPVYEFVLGVGVIQGALLSTGNQISDCLLIVLTSHVNVQLDILQDRLLHFSDVRELPDIIRQHQKIIHFADVIELTFKWIALSEFLSASVIICAVGYVLVTALESNLDSLTIGKLVFYMFVMQLGAFIYCHAGNSLTEKTLNVREAAYGSGWVDLPPETSKILIIIMMRADKPLFLTAGNFCNLNYESFVNILRTAASYLSVIRASSE